MRSRCCGRRGLGLGGWGPASSYWGTRNRPPAPSPQDPSPKSSGRARGFSLIEVLVAIGMVALALTAGLGASMGLTRQAEREPEVLLAQLCAQNALAALRLARQLPEVGDNSQVCSQAGREFEVRLQVQPTAQADFRQVNAQVRQAGPSAVGRADQQVLLSLSTVMGRY